MARVSKRQVKKIKPRINPVDAKYRKDFEDSLGEVDILGQDYPVADVLRAMHPYELKMRYLRYLQDNGVNTGSF